MRHGPADLNRHGDHEAALPFGDARDLKIIARFDRNGREGLAVNRQRQRLDNARAIRAENPAGQDNKSIADFERIEMGLERRRSDRRCGGSGCGNNCGVGAAA